MAIQPYQRAVGITGPGPLVNTSMPSLAPTPDFSRITDQIVDAFEPAMRRKAERAGLEAVGRATIGKDEAGNFVLPEPPPGGGTLFLRAFDRAIGDRYVAEVDASFQQQAAKIGETSRGQPDKLLEELTALRATMIGQVDPLHRGQADVIFNREITQRHYTAANQAAATATANAIAGVKALADTEIGQAIDIGVAGGTDADIEIHLEAARRHTGTLLEMGGLDANGVLAANNAAQLRLRPVFDMRNSLEGAKDLAPRLRGATSRDLETIQAASQEIPFEGKVLGMTYQQLREKLPSPQVFNSIGGQASQILNERDQAAREAAAEARAAAAEARRNRWMLQMTETINRGFSSDLSSPAKDAMDGAFVKAMGGSEKFVANMGTREGQAATLRFVQGETSGYLPRPAQDWLTAQATTGEVLVGARLFGNLREGRNRFGQGVGQLAIQKLPAQVQAIYDQALRMSESGVSAERIQRTFDAARLKKVPSENELFAAWGGDRRFKTDYATKRDIAVRAGVGMADNSRVPGDLVRRVDELTRANLALDGNDPEAALDAAIRQVKGAVVVSRSFEGGIGPSSLFNSVHPDQVGAYLRSKGFEGRLGEPDAKGNRIMLAPLTLRPGSLDEFSVYQVNSKNQVVRSGTIDFLVEMPKAIEQFRSQRETASAGVEAAALAKGRADQLRSTTIKRGTVYNPVRGG